MTIHIIDTVRQEKQYLNITLFHVSVMSLTSDVYQLSDVCQCSFSSFPACTRTTVATYVWSSSQPWKKMPAGTPCQPRMTPASYPAPLGLMSTVSLSYHTLLPESSIFLYTNYLNTSIPSLAQWQQPNLPKPKKVRPSTSRYAALTERGLDVKAAFFPDSSPVQPGGLVESDDL